MEALGQQSDDPGVEENDDLVVVQRVRRAESVPPPQIRQNLVEELATQGQGTEVEGEQLEVEGEQLEVEGEQLLEEGELVFTATCTTCGHEVEKANDKLCQFCQNSGIIDLERQGVKRKQTEQAEGMLAKSARRYGPADVGDNVRVFLAEVDRGRCEFPNVLAVIVSSSDGMYKLATKQGYLNSFYARNQFETLPTKYLMVADVNTGETRALRTAANEQSNGGGQGFSKCGCNKACQNDSCKCLKNKVFCNSRCHGKAANPRCLNHD